jgi:hypothetical protein
MKFNFAQRIFFITGIVFNCIFTQAQTKSAQHSEALADSKGFEVGVSEERRGKLCIIRPLEFQMQKQNESFKKTIFSD